MRERGTADDHREVPRGVSPNMDARGLDDNFRPEGSIIKIPWLPVLLCFGLFFPIVPRIVLADPDTSWLSDTSHTANTRCVGGDHSPSVFHRLART